MSDTNLTSVLEPWCFLVQQVLTDRVWSNWCGPAEICQQDQSSQMAPPTSSFLATVVHVWMLGLFSVHMKSLSVCSVWCEVSHVNCFVCWVQERHVWVFQVYLMHLFDWGHVWPTYVAETRSCVRLFCRTFIFFCLHVQFYFNCLIFSQRVTKEVSFLWRISPSATMTEEGETRFLPYTWYNKPHWIFES